MAEHLGGPTPSRAIHLIEVDGVAKSFFDRAGRRTAAIGNISFVEDEGEFVAIVGPSGCGKTTLLRCLAGLLNPDGGEIRFDGRPVRGVPPALSVVFQEYNRSLFPWLTVEDNVRFPLRKLGKPLRAHRAAAALARVGLSEFARHHPWQLSGGMQQRVAIARAIASQPRVLLLDEPFASVDAQTRNTLQDMTQELYSSLSLTVLHITHDIDEAIFLADRVLVLSRPPSRVLRTVRIDLGRPRDQIETRALPEFQAYRREIYELILDVREASAARSGGGSAPGRPEGPHALPGPGPKERA